MKNKIAKTFLAVISFIISLSVTGYIAFGMLFTIGLGSVYDKFSKFHIILYITILVFIISLFLIGRIIFSSPEKLFINFILSLGFLAVYFLGIHSFSVYDSHKLEERRQEKVSWERENCTVTKVETPSEHYGEPEGYQEDDLVLPESVQIKYFVSYECNNGETMLKGLTGSDWEKDEYQYLHSYSN